MLKREALLQKGNLLKAARSKVAKAIGDFDQVLAEIGVRGKDGDVPHDGVFSALSFREEVARLRRHDLTAYEKLVDLMALFLDASLSFVDASLLFKTLESRPE